jgi:hypothetical protein
VNLGEITNIINTIQDAWLNLEGVEGIGQGKIEGKDCILVFISHQTPEITTQIPNTVNGFNVVLIESGIIHAQHTVEETDSNT